MTLFCLVHVIVCNNPTCRTECFIHPQSMFHMSIWSPQAAFGKRRPLQKKKPVEGHWMNVSLRFLLQQWIQMVHQTATRAHQKGAKTSFPTIEAVGVLHSSSSDEECRPVLIKKRHHYSIHCSRAYSSYSLLSRLKPSSCFSPEDADWSDHSRWDVWSDGPA